MRSLNSTLDSVKPLQASAMRSTIVRS